MTTAHVFPGQGSQTPGMGRAFHDAWPATRSRFDDLNGAADVDLARLCFAADEATLRETANTQPAVYATGVAAHAGALERVDAPEFVAGHSLGHLTAATVAGALDPEAGIELVRRRGELMQRAAECDGPGAMVAVLLADPGVVADACDAVEGASVAAFNAPRQTVVSGTEAAVERATSAVEDETRARTTDLDVGAAFHSPVMRSATDPFAAALDRAGFARASIPVCSDVSTAVYTAPAVARRDLAAQLTAPIDWVGVVEALAARGVDRFVEFPPAGTLAPLIETIAPDAETVELDAPADLP